ncbi:MAG: MgtC/SapB family protein [Candidatus Altiarchaeota archaeon]
MVFDRLVVELAMILDVIFAAFLGLLIGLERKGGPKGAGSRTFSLICMGAAVFTVLSINGFPGSVNPERIVSQIVTGVGFIGGGLIWRERDNIIHGITTAAGVWIAAAVGISVGLGFYILAFIVTLLTMMILSRFHPLSEAKSNITRLIVCENE